MRDFQPVSGTRKVIPLSLLVDNPLQPFNRTTDAATRGLLAEVEKSHYFSPIFVTTNGDGTYTKADGHRRTRVASILNVDRLVCEILPEGTDPREAFIRLNKETRKFLSKDWFDVWAKSTNKKEVLRSFPTGQRKNIERIVDMVGVIDAVALAQQGVSPSIVGTVDNILGLKSDFPAAAEGLVIRAREVLNWLIKYRAQNDATRYIARKVRYGTSGTYHAKRLFKAIVEDTPMLDIV